MLSPGQIIQQDFDARMRRLHLAVTPILAVGSAVLLELDGQPYLCTARHVLTDNNDVSTLYYDARSKPEPLLGDFYTDSGFDIAVRRLTATERDNLSDYLFLEERNLAHPAATTEGWYSAAVGFPATKTRVRYRKPIIQSQKFSLVDLVREERDGSIFVGFDKDRVVAAGTTNQITAPDPYGISGGGVFGHPVRVALVEEGATVRLVGIAIRWKEQTDRIQATATTSCATSSGECPEARISLRLSLSGAWRSSACASDDPDLRPLRPPEQSPSIFLLAEPKLRTPALVEPSAKFDLSGTIAPQSTVLT